MLAAERRARIVDLVRARSTMTNEDLVAELGVSIETVRRDLERLHQDGAVRRVRGGAVRMHTSLPVEPSFPARSDIAAGEKLAIGEHARSLLDGDQLVFIDIGTTAVAVARALVGFFQGTVVTPSMRVAEILSESAGVEVLVPGGRVRAGDMSISGPSARAFLQDINPDVAFIGTGGVDFQAGVTDFELVEVDVKHVVIEHSDRSYALADSSKFAVRAPYRVCDLGDVTAVLTDPEVDDAERAAVEGAGGTVLISKTHR